MIIYDTRWDKCININSFGYFKLLPGNKILFSNTSTAGSNSMLEFDTPEEARAAFNKIINGIESNKSIVYITK